MWRSGWWSAGSGGRRSASGEPRPAGSGRGLWQGLGRLVRTRKPDMTSAPGTMQDPTTGAEHLPPTEAGSVIGLTTVEATQRLARFGPNEIETGRRFWALRT